MSMHLKFLGLLILVLFVVGCSPTITKETRITQVTDTVAVPGKVLELDMPSDSVVYDSDAPPTLPRYKTYEEKLQEAREASKRAADETDAVLMPGQ